MDLFSLLFSSVTLPSCRSDRQYISLCMNKSKCTTDGVTPCWIVLKLLYFPLRSEHRDRAADCREGYKTFCCITFLFPLIIVLQKRYTSLWSPWPAAILTLWVNVRDGKDNRLMWFGKHRHFSCPCTRCSTPPRPRFYFFTENLYLFRGKK